MELFLKIGQKRGNKNSDFPVFREITFNLTTLIQEPTYLSSAKRIRDHTHWTMVIGSRNIIVACLKYMLMA